MFINGKEKILTQPILLNNLLSQLGYRPQLIAVELNGKIIKQAAFASTTVTDADKMEIVSFVGGG